MFPGLMLMWHRYRCSIMAWGTRAHVKSPVLLIRHVPALRYRRFARRELGVCCVGQVGGSDSAWLDHCSKVKVKEADATVAGRFAVRLNLYRIGLPLLAPWT